jgi:hypothetical protein
MKTKTNVSHKLMGFGFAALFVACGFSANAQDSTATSSPTATTPSTYSSDVSSSKPKRDKSDIGDRAFRFGVKGGLNLSQTVHKRRGRGKQIE